MKFIVLFLFITSSTYFCLAQSERYELLVPHPGLEGDGQKVIIHVYKTDKDNFTIEYMATVRSVYCYDSVCRISPVVIHWDNLGRYQKLEIDDRFYLEKQEGVEFKRSDYKKLHTILRDKNSVFRNIRYSEITAPSLEHELDAISSATQLILSNEETIAGASLTCYTLWHWANGAIVDSIREISAQNCTEQKLEEFLTGSDSEYQIFALDELTKGKYYNNELLDKVLELDFCDNSQLQTERIQYIEGLPDSAYVNAIFFLLKRSGEQEISFLLSSLNKSKIDLTSEYIEKLSGILTNLNIYKQIDIMLTIIERYQSPTQQTLENIMVLLDRNILTARRAYWFLKDHNLTEEQRTVLNQFSKLNSDYL